MSLSSGASSADVDRPAVHPFSVRTAGLHLIRAILDPPTRLEHSIEGGNMRTSRCHRISHERRTQGAQ